MADELLNLADEPVENTEAEAETSTPTEAPQQELTFKTVAEKKKYIQELKRKKEEERRESLKAERKEKARKQKELDKASGKTGRKRLGFILVIVAILVGLGVFYYLKMPKEPIVIQPIPEVAVVTVRDSVADEINRMKTDLEEMKEEKVIESKWGISGPCYLISHSSVKNENLAKRSAKKLTHEGFSTGYYWIPDVDAGGHEFFKVYIGPFNTENEAIDRLADVRKYSKKAYILKIK